MTATHIRYYEIIKKPVERLGYSHTWGGGGRRWQPKPGFSNLPNMERWPRPITWPDLLSSHRYRRVHPEFNMAAAAEGGLHAMAQCRPPGSLLLDSGCGVPVGMEVVTRLSALFSPTSLICFAALNSFRSSLFHSVTLVSPQTHTHTRARCTLLQS